MYDLIIKNGLIVNATGSRRGDIAISQGKIALVGEHIDEPQTPQLDAADKLLLPGGIDPHTHFDMQMGRFHTVDDFSYGGRGAISGGVTTVIDHPGFGPADCSPLQPLQSSHQLADGRCCVDHSFHGVIQHWNDQVSADLQQLREAGIASVKTYMTYEHRLSEPELSQLFRRCAELGLLVTIHAEDHEAMTSLTELFARSNLLRPCYHALSRPNNVEAAAVERALRIAHEAGDAPLYFVHISTREALAQIRRAREQGQQNVFAETCTHYLLLEASRYLQQPQGLKYIFNPPLRSRADNEALWRALDDGELQTVGSDHCAFSYLQQKQEGAVDFRLAPAGAPGVEERIPLLYSYGVRKHRLSLERLVTVTSTNAARLFGLYPQKGLLEAGSDADIIVFDPERRRVIDIADLHGASDYSIYQGLPLHGDVEMTLLAGKIAYQQGRVLATDSDGRFLPRHNDAELWQNTR